MGTKNNPGKFDCYEKAEPDEPIFVLLARDPDASILVTMWSLIKVTHELNKDNEEKLREAMNCAHAMEDWFAEHCRSGSQDASVEDDRSSTARRLATESDHAHHGDLDDVPSTQNPVMKCKNKCTNIATCVHKSFPTSFSCDECCSHQFRNCKPI